MLMPDVNILVYAYRVESEQHPAASAWLDALANGDAPFALSTGVATGFVRVVTGTSVFASKPSPMAAALEFVDELFAAESCRWVSPAAEHWRLFSRLCTATRSKGKTAADAVHAAVAIENGCTLASCDRDFERFAEHGLRWLHLDW